jgi:hypothetical protein
LTFQFGKGSKVPLWNFKELFVGKVKSYPNSTQALESGIIFTDIELDQDTVLKLEDNGPSYMVADVQFGKNISGIYSVTFDNTPYGDKSSDRSQLARELEDNKLTVANSSIVEIRFRINNHRYGNEYSHYRCGRNVISSFIIRFTKVL